MGPHTTGTAARCAAVVGATTETGAALAHLLAERGYDLLLTSSDGAALQHLAADLAEEHPVDIVAHQCDLTDSGALTRLLWALVLRDVEVLAVHGGICATYTNTHPYSGEQVTQVGVDVTAVHEVVLAVLPRMRQHAAGAILIDTTIDPAGLHPDSPTLAQASTFAAAFAAALQADLADTPVACTLLPPDMGSPDSPTVRDTALQALRALQADLQGASHP